MTVQDWVDFLQKDNHVRQIGIEEVYGFPCLEDSYIEKENFNNSMLRDWGDDEVLWVRYTRPDAVVIVYKDIYR